AAELGAEVRRPKATLLDPLHQRRRNAAERREVELEGLEREDLFADEFAHPRELLLELWFGVKVPGPDSFNARRARARVHAATSRCLERPTGLRPVSLVALVAD